ARSRAPILVNQPPTTLTSPETPPTAVSPRLSQVWESRTGPSSTSEARTVHAEPEIRNHAPQRDHHSRSSSSVHRLMRPTSAVAASRKVPITNPGASAAYSIDRAATSGNTLAASPHAIAPPTAPATTTTTTSATKLPSRAPSPPRGGWRWPHGLRSHRV